MRHDSPDGRSLAVVVPCAGRGLRGRVLSLVSVYGPVSGSGFDDERRDMFEGISFLLGRIPANSVWVVGGDFNAEVGFPGIGEESTFGEFAHGRRTRAGHQLVEWAKGEELRFLLSFSKQAFVGLGTIGFWVRLRFCSKSLSLRLGRPTRITTPWRSVLLRNGFFALLPGYRAR